MFIKMHKEYGKYIEHYSHIRGAWNKVETFLQTHCPLLFETLKGKMLSHILITKTCPYNTRGLQKVRGKVLPNL